MSDDKTAAPGRPPTAGERVLLLEARVAELERERDELKGELDAANEELAARQERILRANESTTTEVIEDTPVLSIPIHHPTGRCPRCPDCAALAENDKTIHLRTVDELHDYVARFAAAEQRVAELERERDEERALLQHKLDIRKASLLAAEDALATLAGLVGIDPAKLPPSSMMTDVDRWNFVQNAVERAMEHWGAKTERDALAAEVERLRAALQRVVSDAETVGFGHHGMARVVTALAAPSSAAAVLSARDERVRAENEGPGTPTARWHSLMDALEKRFPDPEPLRSDRMSEEHYLAAIDALPTEVRRVALEEMHSAVSNLVVGEAARLSRATLSNIAECAFMKARDALATPAPATPKEET